MRDELDFLTLDLFQGNNKKRYCKQSENCYYYLNKYGNGDKAMGTCRVLQEELDHDRSSEASIKRWEASRLNRIEMIREVAKDVLMGDYVKSHGGTYTMDDVFDFLPDNFFKRMGKLAIGGEDAGCCKSDLIYGAVHMVAHALDFDYEDEPKEAFEQLIKEL